MSIWVNRLAPQAVVLAVALYLSWPSLMDSFWPAAHSASKAAIPAGTKELSAAMLSPRRPPPLKRELFLRAGTSHLAKTKADRLGSKGAAAVTAADAKGSGLVLAATCIVGQKRMAMINGKVYREKDAIQGSGKEPVNYVIAQILPHKVLLSSQGGLLQLSYTNAAAKPSKDKSPRKPAK